MKILVKIGVLLLMLVLLFAAFVLPKFVQRTEPPMPEEDLAAALAAVELGEESEGGASAETPDSSPPEETGSSLRSDERLAAFYTALDGEDFVTSGDILVRLSSELEPELVDQLALEMEEAVAALGTGEPSEESSKIALLDGIDVTPSKEMTTSEAGDPTRPDIPTAASTPAPADPAAVVAFFTLVQTGDFEAASSELERLENTADPATVASMRTALSSAKAREEALEQSRNELEKSQMEMARLQQESVSKLEESVKQLAEVTRAAQAATREASRLKTELATAEAEAEADSPPEPEKEPLEIPESRSIAFGFDSTFLNDASRDLITSTVVPALENEKRLEVQLRGHADTTGPSDYNGILAQARCEIVKDFLLEQGIAADRIHIVSFGETQAAATGGTPEELRRVDIIFRPR